MPAALLDLIPGNQTAHALTSVWRVSRVVGGLADAMTLFRWTWRSLLYGGNIARQPRYRRPLAA